MRTLGTVPKGTIGTPVSVPVLSSTGQLSLRRSRAAEADARSVAYAWPQADAQQADAKLK